MVLTVAERARVKTCVFDVFDLTSTSIECWRVEGHGRARGVETGRGGTRGPQRLCRSEIEIWLWIRIQSIRIFDYITLRLYAVITTRPQS